MTGKANLEVRPRFVNKGEIAKRLILDYGDGPGEAPEFVLCLGDDFTDEGMCTMISQSNPQLTTVRHVPFATAVKVAPGPCVLGYCGCQLEANAGQLASPRALRCYLMHIASQRVSGRRKRRSGSGRRRGAHPGREDGIKSCCI
jgi:hypothetical protein